MAYFDTIRRNELVTKQGGQLATNRDMIDRKPEVVKFYEYEAAIVLDVVLDENHPILQNKTIIPNDYHKNLDGTPPTREDTNYGWIGCIKFRFINTDAGVPNDQLQWAFPLENTGTTELPLINEVVAVVEYLGKLYYTKKINMTGATNASAKFNLEPAYGFNDESVREFGTADEFKGVESTVNVSPQGSGKLGKIFKFNPDIRALRRYEGDTIVESRFGSSIRFGAYGPVSASNEAASGYKNYSAGTGNPWLLIRNRQADLDATNKVTNHPKTYVTESVNNDGSSIQLTSGKTESDFKTTVKKSIFSSDVKEEQPKFSPNDISKTNFKFPKLDGDQIVINSDRLVFQARGKEFIQYAKQRFAIATDGEFTVDAKRQIVLTTNSKTVINSPKIYLGEAVEFEPALLGRSTVLWMHTLCDWLLFNVNTQIAVIEANLLHMHLSLVGPTTPPILPPTVALWGGQLVSLRAQQLSLLALQNKLSTLMSSRVFITGGGGAPGANGG